MPVRSSEWTRVKPAGLLGELRGVRLSADLRRGERAAARDDEAAGHHRLARLLQHGIGLAGQQRLVDLQAVALQHLAVHDDLVARAQLDHVAEDHLGGGDLGGHPVAPDRRSGLADHGEVVQGLLGAQLLDDADAGVGDDHEAEQPVLDRPDDQDDHEEHADDGVEPGEDVGADDLGGRAGGAYGDVVDLAPGDPFGDLGRGQSAVRRSGRRTCRPVRLLDVGPRPLRHALDVTGGSGNSPAGWASAVGGRPRQDHAASGCGAGRRPAVSRRALDRGVPPADVPDAEQAQAAAGQAGPHPPGVAAVGVPAVEGELAEEEHEPDDGAAGDRADDGALKRRRGLAQFGLLPHGAQLTGAAGGRWHGRRPGTWQARGGPYGTRVYARR